MECKLWKINDLKEIICTGPVSDPFLCEKLHVSKRSISSEKFLILEWQKYTQTSIYISIIFPPYLLLFMKEAFRNRRGRITIQVNCKVTSSGPESCCFVLGRLKTSSHLLAQQLRMWTWHRGSSSAVHHECVNCGVRSSVVKCPEMEDFHFSWCYFFVWKQKKMSSRIYIEWISSKVCVPT